MSRAVSQRRSSGPPSAPVPPWIPPVRRMSPTAVRLAVAAMSKTVHAIFENGVRRPTQPVDLPDRCDVEFEVRAVSPTPNGDRPAEPNWDELDAILGRPVETGAPD